MKTISVANDFSVYPGGRIPDDGPYSGQRFREEFLVPAIRSEQKTVIEFDNVRGYGSSFLEEAFGGLIRIGIPKETVRQFLELKSSKKSIIDDVNKYIDNA